MKTLVSPLPPHPGFVLRSFLPLTGLTSYKLAKMMGVNRATLHYILHGRTGISPAMAVRLAAVFDVPAAKWLNLQQRYDIAYAELEFAEEIAAIPRYEGPALDILRLLG